MKKKRFLPLAAVLLLLLWYLWPRSFWAAVLLLLLWYLWPRSFWAALPGYQPEEDVTACYAILSPRDPGDGTPMRTVEFSPGSSEYEQLTALLESSAYRRGIFDLIRLGRASDTQLVTLSPYVVSIYFRQQESQWSMDFWGPQAVANSSIGSSRTYHPTEGFSFQQKVADFVSSLLQEPSS